jgi:hypothetical protein
MIKFKDDKELRFNFDSIHDFDKKNNSDLKDQKKYPTVKAYIEKQPKVYFYDVLDLNTEYEEYIDENN